MGIQEWNESGKGEGVGTIDLDDLYMLAIRGGFVFTTDDNVPAKKRANLQSMFDFFDVTSLSSFRRKFYDYRLCPNPGKSMRKMWKLDGPSEADDECSRVPSGVIISNDAMIMLIARARSGTSPKNSTISSSSSGLNNNNNNNNTVQCEGVLRQKGSLADIVRIGTFEFDSFLTCDHNNQNTTSNKTQHNTQQQQQRQEGYGAIYTPRGEMFHGFFKNGTMWGPGVYVFPNSAGTASESKNVDVAYEEKTRRVRFRGMHNGKPKGLGCMTWSNGKEEWGLFDGYELVRECDESECQGVVVVAEENAEFAKRVVSEILDELKSGNLECKNSHWEEYGGILLQGLPLHYT